MVVTKYASANHEDHAQLVDSISDEEIATLAADNPHQLFLAGCVGVRPGLADAIKEIEDSLYPPDHPENAKFELIFIRWKAMPELLWQVFIFPLDERSLVEPVLNKHGFRISDGIPTVFDEKPEPTLFPINDAPNFFTIEGKGGYVSIVALEG